MILEIDDKFTELCEKVKSVTLMYSNNRYFSKYLKEVAKINFLKKMIFIVCNVE